MNISTENGAASSSFLRTVEVRGIGSFKEHLERRKDRLRKLNGIRLTVRKEDRARLRKSSKLCSYRINKNGVCSEHVFCRTEQIFVGKFHLMRTRRRGRSTVLKKKAVGKFRSKCTFFGTGRLDDEIGVGEDSREKEMVECLEEVIVDDSLEATESGSGENSSAVATRRRRLKGRRKEGILEGMGRRHTKPEETRIRKRRMVNVENYVMFNLGRIAPTGNSINGNVNESGLSEQAKLNQSFEECSLCIQKLYTTWSELPFFRCSGGRRRNHKFSCVSTLRMKRNVTSDGTLYCAIISFVIEEQSNKIRNITIRKEKQLCHDGTWVKESTQCYVHAVLFTKMV